MKRDPDDTRCWHELEFDDLAAEARGLALDAGDTVLSRLAENLALHSSQTNADLVIDRIENEHAQC